MIMKDGIYQSVLYPHMYVYVNTNREPTFCQDDTNYDDSIKELLEYKSLYVVDDIELEETAYEYIGTCEEFVKQLMLEHL